MNFISELAFGKVYERPAAQQLATLLWPGSLAVACNRTSDIDFAVTSPTNELLGFIETKARKAASTQFDSTIISMRKHHAGRFAKEFFKVPTFAVIVFTDVTGYLPLHEAPDSEDFVTRADRGKSVLHAFYLHKRIIWRPDLHEAIGKMIAAEQGIEQN